MPVAAVIAPRFMGPGPPIIALLAVPGYYATYRCWPEFPRAALLWALAFPALMLASGLWGIDPAMAVERSLKTLPVTLSGAALFSLGKHLDEEPRKLFRRWFPAAVLAAGALCVIELYAEAPLYKFFHELINAAPPKKIRPHFNMSNLNRSVVMFMLSSFIAFACLRSDAVPAHWRMPGLLLLAAAVALVLSATSSQSSQMAFVLGVFVILLFPARSKWAWTGLSVILTTLLMLTPWLAQFMFHALAERSGEVSWLQSSYIPYRMEIWDFVSRRALQRPFFGWGVEATQLIKDFDSAKIYWPTTQILHPHNFAVQLWIEFGVLGAATGAAFLSTLLQGLRRVQAPQARIVLGVLLASLSVAATGYGLWQSWWLGIFCLLFGYVALVLPPPPQNQY